MDLWGAGCRRVQELQAWFACPFAEEVRPHRNSRDDDGTEDVDSGLAQRGPSLDNSMLWTGCSVLSGCCNPFNASSRTPRLDLFDTGCGPLIRCVTVHPFGFPVSWGDRGLPRGEPMEGDRRSLRPRWAVGVRVVWGCQEPTPRLHHSRISTSLSSSSIEYSL